MLKCDIGSSIQIELFFKLINSVLYTNFSSMTKKKTNESIIKMLIDFFKIRQTSNCCDI